MGDSGDQVWQACDTATAAAVPEVPDFQQYSFISQGLRLCHPGKPTQQDPPPGLS